MSARFLVDTDVLIDSMRRDVLAAGELARLLRRGRLGVSVVTRMELIVGCRDKQALAITQQLLNGLERVSLNEGISDIADGLISTFHLSHSLKIADAFICATALYYALPFLTKNQRDFRFIPGLKLLPYPAAPTASS